MQKRVAVWRRNAVVMAERRQDDLSFALLEHRRLEAMSLKQLVELGSVALGELSGLCDVATGDLEQPSQVIALKSLARFLERHEHGGILLQRVLDQRRRNHGRR